MKWRQISLDPVIRYFVPPLPLREENYEAKEEERKSIHFNGSHGTIEFLLRKMISANQLGIYGAVAGFCDEVPKRIKAPGNLQHLIVWKRWKFFPTSLLLNTLPINAQQTRNLVQEYERKLEQLTEDQTLSKLSSDACLMLVEPWQYLCTLDTEEGQQMQHLCREDTVPRNERKTRVKGCILKYTRVGLMMDIKVCPHEDRCSIEVLVQSLFQDRTSSCVRIVNGVDKYVTESMLTTNVWTAHLTRHIFSQCCTTNDTHTRGSSRFFWRAHITFHVSSSCAHVVSLILFNFSTFLSLLSIFSPIVLSFFLAINFIFHDVVDKFLVHFC